MHPGVMVAGAAAGLVGLAGLGAAAVVATSAMGNSNNAQGGCPLDSTTTSTVTGVSGSGFSTVPATPGAKADLLFKAIISMSHGSNRAVASGFLGTNLESEWNTDIVNSIGATGAWQILLSVHHEITSSEAKDPVVSTHIWFPHYLAALPSISDSEWTSDPERAAEEVTVIAEVPGPSYYELQGADTVHAKWQQTLQMMRRYGISTDFSAGNSTATLVSGTVPTSITGAVMGLNTEANGACTDGVYENGQEGTTDGGSSPDPGSVLLAFAPTASAKRNAIVALAAHWIGEPYSFAGGNTKGPTYGVCTNDAGFNDCNIQGFDCSGLTLYLDYQILGIQLPHNAAEQWNILRSYTAVTRGQSLQNARPGDNVYFTGSDGSFAQPGHVGIYIGNGKMIDAPQSGERVQVDDITAPYWQSTFVGIADPIAFAATQHQAA